MLLAGFLVAQKRAPELKEIEKGESEMEMILYLALLNLLAISGALCG